MFDTSAKSRPGRTSHSKPIVYTRIGYRQTDSKRFLNFWFLLAKNEDICEKNGIFDHKNIILLIKFQKKFPEARVHQ